MLGSFADRQCFVCREHNQSTMAHATGTALLRRFQTSLPNSRALLYEKTASIVEKDCPFVKKEGGACREDDLSRISQPTGTPTIKHWSSFFTGSIACKKVFSCWSRFERNGCLCAGVFVR